MERVLPLPSARTFTLSIDPQGLFTMTTSEQEEILFEPEEAYHLLQFLYTHKDLLYNATTAQRALFTEMWR